MGDRLMAIVCIQCSMRALLNGEPVPRFDETLTEHMRRCHPDPAATQSERRELEKKLTKKLKTEKKQ